VVNICIGGLPISVGEATNHLIGSSVKISVIISHLNQEEDLNRCLRALADQKDARTWEVIVVDNGSTHLPKLNGFEGAQIVLTLEQTPGPGPARNTGAALTNGEVLAFIDADCVPADDWLSQIHQAFNLPDTEIVGGEVLVDVLSNTSPPKSLFYEKVYSFRNGLHVRDGFSVTSNMAVRREVFERVGPFGGIDIAEDRDWGMRATALGASFRFLPSLVVIHPPRHSFSELKKKWLRHIAHERMEWSKKQHGSLLWSLRAFAVAISPVLEIAELAKSKKLSGFAERFLAFVYLIRIRLFRAQIMIAYAFGLIRSKPQDFWNR